MHHEPDKEVKGHLERLLKYFNACVANRNHLLHSQHTGDADKDLLTLRKNIRGDWANFFAFKLGLPQLRRIADEMNAGTDYLFAIWEHLEARDGMRFKVDLVSGQRQPVTTPPPLLKKPHVPKSLRLSKSVRIRKK